MWVTIWYYLSPYSVSVLYPSIMSLNIPIVSDLAIINYGYKDEAIEFVYGKSTILWLFMYFAFKFINVESECKLQGEIYSLPTSPF